MKHIYILALLSLCTFSISFSQEITTPDIPQITYPSSNVEGLYNFSKVPVSLYNGIPEVSIPLFNLEARGYSLPVSISYHASGIRVQDLGSKIGMGWSLNSGGAIFREQKGRWQDEKETLGFFNKCSEVAALDETLPYDEYIHSIVGFSDHDMNDGEPDLFTISLPTVQVQFVLDCNGQPVFYTHSNALVTIEEQIADDITKWKVVDEDGNQYFLSDYERTYMNDTYAPGICGGQLPTAQFTDLGRTTAWFVSKIITSRNDEITFNYMDENMHYTLLSSEKIIWSGTLGSYAGCQYGYQTHTQYDINSKSLESIQVLSSGYTVSFVEGNLRMDIPSGVYNSTPYGQNVVDKVLLKNNNDEEKISYVFNYKYMDNTAALQTGVGTYDEKYRLMLVKLTKNESAINSINWEFEYKLGSGFPSRNSFAKDLGGYFNGETLNNSLVEDIYDVNMTSNPNVCTTCITNKISDRTSSFDHASIGILKKIIYPTGGYTEFEYEFNENTSCNDADKMKAIRVARVTNNPISGNSISTEYVYAQEQCLAIDNSAVLGGYLKCNPDDGVTYIDYNSISSRNIRKSGSATQVYPIVVEKQIGLNGETNGYNVSYFSFKPDDKYNLISDVFLIDNSWKRGWLDSVYTYNDQDNLVFKARYTYKNSEDNPNDFASVNSRSVKSIIVKTKTRTQEVETYKCVSGGGLTNEEKSVYRFLSSKTYEVNSHHHYLSQKEEVLFPAESELSTVTNYMYDPDNYVIENTSTIGSNGKTRDTYYRYPKDFSSECLPNDIASSAILALKNKNILHNPLEVWETIDGKTVKAELSEFKSFGEVVRPYKIFSLELTNPINDFQVSSLVDDSNDPGCLQTFQKDGRYVNTLEVDKFDEFGNNVEYHDRTMTKKSIVYGYGNLKPVANVVNAEEHEVLFDSFEDSNLWLAGDESTVSFTSLEKKVGNQSLKLFHHHAGAAIIPVFEGVIYEEKKYRVEAWVKGRNANFKIRQYCGAQSYDEISSADNPTTDSEWQWYTWEFVLPNSCPTAIQLILENNYEGPGTETDKTVYFDELRLYPLDAQINTYTYDPLFGITSETDSNGVTTRYEYDDFGRLLKIVDNNGNIIKSFEYHYTVGN